MLIANQKGTKISSYIHAVREQSLSKDMQWIEKMVRANKIFPKRYNNSDRIAMSDSIHKNDVNAEIVTEYLRVMGIITSVLETCYGVNWDMHLQLAEDITPFSDHDGEDCIEHIGFDLIPIIHYPEIEIESENGATHTIKDFYITFEIRFNLSDWLDEEKFSFSITNISGFRTTLSFAEWNVGYRHSHVGATSIQPHASSIMSSKAYCTGSGDISTILPQINSEAMGISEDSIGFLFAIIDTMVRWESISGNPHHYVNQITETTSRYQTRETLEDAIVDEYVKKFMKVLRTNVFRDIPRIDFAYNSGKFFANLTAQHEEAIKQLLADEFGWSKKVIIQRVDNYTYGYITDEQADLTGEVASSGLMRGEIPYLFISGEKKYLKIGVPENNNEESNITNFHVRKQFLNKLEDEFNKFAYKQEVQHSIKATCSSL